MIATELVVVTVIAIPVLAMSPVVTVAVAITIAIISAMVTGVILIALVALCVFPVVIVSEIPPALLLGEITACNAEHQRCRCKNPFPAFHKILRSLFANHFLLV